MKRRGFLKTITGGAVGTIIAVKAFAIERKNDIIDIYKEYILHYSPKPFTCEALHCLAGDEGIPIGIWQSKKIGTIIITTYKKHIEKLKPIIEYNKPVGIYVKYIGVKKPLIRRRNYLFDMARRSDIWKEGIL